MEETYNKLKKKYNLPNLDLLDEEFEVSSIEFDHFILRQFRRKIIEKLEEIRRVFDNIVQTETNLVSILEASVFSDAQKNEVLNLYRKMMFFDRWSFELDIEGGDAKNAEFLREVTAFWKSSKRELLSYAKKIKDCWHQETASTERAGYFG